MTAHIAILEDDEARTAAMRVRLTESFSNYKSVFFDNAPDMIEWLRDHSPSTVLICLDHDLGPSRTRSGEAFDPGTGQDVVNYLATQKPLCPVIIHTANYLPAPGMALMLGESGWTCCRVAPVDNLEWINETWVPAMLKYLGNKCV